MCLYSAGDGRLVLLINYSIYFFSSNEVMTRIFTDVIEGVLFT